MAKRDDFDDLPDQNYGALGGLGTEAFDKVTQKFGPEGLHTICYCEFCGTKNDIVSSWPEVVTGSMGYMSPNWFVEDGLLYPHVGCANAGCRRQIGIRFAPAELGRYAQGAVQQGYLHPQEFQRIQAGVAQAAGARR